jgi:hypothetical protein
VDFSCPLCMLLWNLKRKGRKSKMSSWKIFNVVYCIWKLEQGMRLTGKKKKTKSSPEILLTKYFTL